MERIWSHSQVRVAWRHDDSVKPRECSHVTWWRRSANSAFIFFKRTLNNFTNMMTLSSPTSFPWLQGFNFEIHGIRRGLVSSEQADAIEEEMCICVKHLKTVWVLVGSSRAFTVLDDDRENTSLNLIKKSEKLKSGHRTRLVTRSLRLVTSLFNDLGSTGIWATFLWRTCKSNALQGDTCRCYTWTLETWTIRAIGDRAHVTTADPVNSSVVLLIKKKELWSIRLDYYFNSSGVFSWVW